MTLLSSSHSSTVVGLAEVLVEEALAVAAVAAVEDSLAVDAPRSTFEVLRISGTLVRWNPSLYVTRIGYLLCYFFAFHRCFSTIYCISSYLLSFPCEIYSNRNCKNAFIFLCIEELRLSSFVFGFL